MTLGAAIVNRRLADFERADVSLHTVAEPGATGAGEVSGHLYQRQPPPSYRRIQDNGTTSSSDVLFTGLPRTDIRAVGFWLGGEFITSRPVERRQTSQGDGYRLVAGAITVYEMDVEG